MYHGETRTMHRSHTVANYQTALVLRVIKGSYREREMRLIRGICKAFPLRDVRGRNGLYDSGCYILPERRVSRLRYSCWLFARHQVCGRSLQQPGFQ